MKKLFITTTSTLLVATACQSNMTKEAVKNQELTQEAIAIHDEIMPQISIFDRTAVRIDSILNNLSQISASQPSVDTTALRTDLQTLKTNLETATDNMMTWMHGYVADSTDTAYQQAEIEKVRAMKKQFEEVSKESDKKLSSF